MHRQNVIVVMLLVIVSAFVVTAGYAQGGGPLGLLSGCVTRLTGGSSEVVGSNRLVSETTSNGGFSRATE